MKKFVAIILALIMMTFQTPVRAENFGIEDLIPENSEITELPAPEPTAEDWDDVVERFKDHHEDRTSDEIKSIDQIADLIGMLEDSRQDALTNHHNIMGEGGHLGIGIWEKDDKKMKAVKKIFEVLVAAFKAKTGVRVFFEKERERPEDGYVLWCFYTKEAPYYKTHPVRTIGQSAYAQWNTADGLYYESAWDGGSGKQGYINNTYVSYNQPVKVVAVAYLNDNNEVVEVIDQPGATIDCSQPRMLLAKTETTILGWFPPENLVTD